MRVELCSVDTIIPIRHLVLRKGRPVEDAHFKGDDDASTQHFALFDKSVVIACTSFFYNPLDSEFIKQLRGMAVHPDFQGQNCGGYILDGAENLLRKQGIPGIWCNARIEAVNFYKRQGWEQISSVFWVDTVGPHVKMKKQIV